MHFGFKFIVNHFRCNFQNIYLTAFYVYLKRVVQGRTNMLLSLFDDKLVFVRNRMKYAH